MQVRGVDFVAVCVPEGKMAEAKQFYGEVLGLPAEGIMNDSWAEYRAGHLTIGLDSAPFLAPGWDRQPGGEVRIALAVDDVAGAVAELQKKGVQPALETEDCGVCVQAAVRDPFGNLIFLHRRQDGTAG